jgi:hypothetical protein
MPEAEGTTFFQILGNTSSVTQWHVLEHRCGSTSSVTQRHVLEHRCGSTSSVTQHHILEHNCGNLKSDAKLYLWTELQATIKVQAVRPVKTEQAASLVSCRLSTFNFCNTAIVTLNYSLQRSHPSLFLWDTECHNQQAATWPAGSSWAHLNLVTQSECCYTLLLCGADGQLRETVMSLWNVRACAQTHTHTHIHTVVGAHQTLGHRITVPYLYLELT